jgi:DNA-binding MarR family transcriptional regulator
MARAKTDKSVGVTNRQGAEQIDKGLTKTTERRQKAKAKKPLSRGYTVEGAAMTNLILTLFRVNGRLMRGGDELVRDLGLTSARWQVFGAIRDRPRTVAQIARHFESTRQGVLWVVSGLLKSGLVELVDNPDHKRAKLVNLTERGREIFDKVVRRQEDWVNSFSGRFSLEEIRTAVSVLEQLGRELNSLEAG